MNKIKYSQNEKEIRHYNVFKGKKNSTSSGFDLIVTNKRVVAITYNQNTSGFSQEVKEIPLKDVDGTITTSISFKRKISNIIIFGCLFLVFFIFGLVRIIEEYDEIGLSILFLIVALLFAFCAIRAFMSPATEGVINLPETSNKKGVQFVGGFVKRSYKGKLSIRDVTPGRDFKIVQSELGAVIESAKNDLEFVSTKVSKANILNVDESEDIPLL